MTTIPVDRLQSARTPAELVFVAGHADPDRTVLRYKVDGQWQDESCGALAGTVRALAAGLIESGVRPGERICLLAGTRREWTYASLAVLATGAIVVPIYPTSSVEESAWVIGDSGATTVIYDTERQHTKLVAVSPMLASTPRLVGMGPAGRPEHTLDELIERGRAALAGGDSAPAADELRRRLDTISLDDPAVIIYTSGTTGPPKGCVLTHRNWLRLCEVNAELDYLTHDDVVYLFLPLAHVFAQMQQFACLASGATLAYFGGDITQVLAEVVEVRPTFLPSVPRIFEKMYTAVTAQLDEQTVRDAVRVGLEVRRRQRAGEPIPPELAGPFERLEPLFAKVRAAFGGRVRQALSGGAPISPDVLRFFHAAGVAVLEGYGMTETTGLGTVNTVDSHKIGSVGRPGPGVEMRIADDGEILVRGPHLFAGYWRNPEATAEAVPDGWLRTGDLGVMDEDGFVSITGRKKEIIITAGGKNIAPATIENELRQSRWISHAVMYGDRRPYPVALITLDWDEVLPWATERGLPDDPGALAGHPDVHALVAQAVDTVNARHAATAQVKRFAILDRELTAEHGELTASMKMKRRVIYDNHAELFGNLYAGG
jgi:long-chain acyl-CoA synthetase